MVAILLAEGFEEIEALTVVDVLRRVEVPVQTISIHDSLHVMGRSRIKVICDSTINELDQEKIQMVVLPGGMPGTTNLDKSEAVQSIIQFAVNKGIWISAICAAPSVLGKKGYLKGIEATCFPGFESHLEGAHCLSDCVVKSGNFITSRGPGTAIEFAFEIVKVLKGAEAVTILQKEMLYEFT